MERGEGAGKERERERRGKRGRRRGGTEATKEEREGAVRGGVRKAENCRN